MGDVERDKKNKNVIQFYSQIGSKNVVGDYGS